jgi:hypothetical protein
MCITLFVFLQMKGFWRVLIAKSEKEKEKEKK